MCIVLKSLARRTAHPKTPAAGFLLLASVAACGQVREADDGLIPSMLVEPRVAVSETFTDNVRLANSNRHAEQITEISPAIRVTKNGRQLNGYLDYALTGVAYAQGTSPDLSRNTLNAFGTLEAVDNLAYVEFSGLIAQQTISAFGTQSDADSRLNANKTEVSSYQLSPYVRGYVGNLLTYGARLQRNVTHSDTAASSDVATTEAILNLSGSTVFQNLGWSADASRQSIDYSAGRPTEADRTHIGLSYLLTPQFSVFANAGGQSSNYTSPEKKYYATTGMGASWLPSERTKVSVAAENRSFGNSHSVTVEHQTARTAWRYFDSRDVTASPSQTGWLISRADTGALVISSFLSSAVSLQHRQDLSVTLLGVRETVTISAAQSENSRLDTLSGGIDDLSESLVRQSGLSIDWTHRLTPTYTLAVLASQQDTSGSLSRSDTKLQFLSVALTARGGKYMTTSLGMRRAVYSSISPYDETAVTLHLTMQL